MRGSAEGLKQRAKGALSDGEARVFIGYERGRDVYHPIPFFATTPAEADRLVLDEFCAFNLAKYLLYEQQEEGRVGIVVKGCDSLGIQRLLKDNRIAREKALILGVPCTGVLDPAKVAAVGLGEIKDVRDAGEEYVVVTGGGERRLKKSEYLLERCLRCDTPNPVVYDELIGVEVQGNPIVSRSYAEVEEVERLSSEERASYWNRQFMRCIRCYACRNVCPACNCRECCLDSTEPRWTGRETVLSEQQMFHFIRALDVAGRCIDCGECERVCPMGIPLMKLNRKLMKDIQHIFGVERPHIPADIEPFGQFRPDDHDEFN